MSIDSSPRPAPCFNSRSREGSDWAYLHQRATRRRFNSRSREGSDVEGADTPEATEGVSIHAPVKGATDLPHLDEAVTPVSIHAPVKGATKDG